MLSCKRTVMVYSEILIPFITIESHIAKFRKHAVAYPLMRLFELSLFTFYLSFPIAGASGHLVRP
jgi:hypothetical protein